MKFSTIFFLFILFTSLTASAQKINITFQEWKNFGKDIRNGIVRVVTKDQFKGSPYLTDWTKGHVIFNNGSVAEPFMLKYDMERNAVLFSRNDKLYAFPAKQLKGFVIYTSNGNIKFRNGFKTNINDINENTLLRVIYGGNIQLLAHHSCELHENIPTYGMAGNLNEYVTDVDFYLVTKNGFFHEVELEKDDILEVLENQRKELDEFAKAEHLNFEKEQDLRLILAHYDHLITAKPSAY